MLSSWIFSTVLDINGNTELYSFKFLLFLHTLSDCGQNLYLLSDYVYLYSWTYLSWDACVMKFKTYFVFEHLMIGILVVIYEGELGLQKALFSAIWQQ